MALVSKGRMGTSYGQASTPYHERVETTSPLRERRSARIRGRGRQGGVRTRSGSVNQKAFLNAVRFGKMVKPKGYTSKHRKTMAFGGTRQKLNTTPEFKHSEHSALSSSATITTSMGTSALGGGNFQNPFSEKIKKAKQRKGLVKNDPILGR